MMWIVFFSFFWPCTFWCYRIVVFHHFHYIIDLKRLKYSYFGCRCLICGRQMYTAGKLNTLTQSWKKRNEKKCCLFFTLLSQQQRAKHTPSLNRKGKTDAKTTTFFLSCFDLGREIIHILSQAVSVKLCMRYKQCCKKKVPTKFISHWWKKRVARAFFTLLFFQRFHLTMEKGAISQRIRFSLSKW